MSRRRTRRRSVRTRRLLFLALFVGAALVGANFVRVIAQEQALARERVAVLGDIAMLEVQNTVLGQEIERRKTPGYIEQKARELGYVRPGEGLATLRGPIPAPSRSASQASADSRLARWLRFFFDR